MQDAMMFVAMNGSQMTDIRQRVDYEAINN